MIWLTRCISFSDTVIHMSIDGHRGCHSARSLPCPAPDTHESPKEFIGVQFERVKSDANNFLLDGHASSSVDFFPLGSRKNIKASIAEVLPLLFAPTNIVSLS